MKIPDGRFHAPQEPVVIEYDSRGRRVTKTFTNAYEARRFWISKDRQGRNPHVVKCTKDKQSG